MRELPAGTVTFLFTDVEGSTRLLHELGPERYAKALAEHRRLLRDAFARHGGIEVDTQGDAFFVAFPDAGEALEAAAEGQRALRAGSISVRMALHSGEPIVTQEGYVGMDVHRAARICSTAHGGQVVASARTKALVDDELVDLGLHRLKDLGEPERLFQVGTGAFPPLRSLNATNLPTQASRLIGRERELEELVALVVEERLVTLTGAGGSGKTRFGLHVAAELVEEFPDGVFWVPLAEVTDPELVVPTIASNIGARGELADHIDERRTLFLLDNLEQVLGAALYLSKLLGRCPNLHLIVTSRALLRIEGEREYVVEPLPAPDAVALFRARAAVAEPADAVVEICRRVDCLPLAVELAAARTAILSPEALLARLEQRLPLLTGGRRDAPHRQRTLRATIEWSYELLDADEKELFARLAVFAGSFDVAAAEEVAGAELDTLQMLVDNSLVRRWASGRLGMLETIHEFALERLEDSGEAEDLRRRHFDYLLALARSANLSDEAEGPERIDLVRPEASNVRAALKWTLAADEIERGLRLAVALGNFWLATAPFEGMRWFDLLLGRAEELPADLRAAALGGWGAVTFIVGRFDEGARLWEESLSIYRELGDERGVGSLLASLAHAALIEGDTARARSLAEESRELSRRTAYHDIEPVALRALGEAEFAEGNHELGLQLIEEGIAVAREMGGTWWKVFSSMNLAGYLMQLGRLDEAEECIREALPDTLAIGERQSLLTGLADLARIAAKTGRPHLAGTLWGAIETEEARGPVGQWESERPEYEAAVLAAAGPDFDRGRAAGRALTLDEVVEYALGDA
jgi:predicted ATPase/class 3 adenylate cyclase